MSMEEISMSTWDEDWEEQEKEKEEQLGLVEEIPF